MLPTRAYDGDAGLDLYACQAVRARARASARAWQPGSPSRSRTGMPVSCCRARDSPPAHGIALVNAPGLIDSGYRGELRVLLLNTDARDASTVDPGDRIAQLLIVALAPVDLSEVAALADSERDERGFGSSG